MLWRRILTALLFFVAQSATSGPAFGKTKERAKGDPVSTVYYYMNKNNTPRSFTLDSILDTKDGNGFCAGGTSVTKLFGGKIRVVRCFDFNGESKREDRLYYILSSGKVIQPGYCLYSSKYERDVFGDLVMTYEEKTLWSGDFLFFSQHVKKESKQTQAKVLDEWLAAANYLKPDMWSNVDDVSEGLTQKDILEFRSFILSNGSSLTKSLFQKNCSTAMPRPEPAETRDLKKLHIFDYQSAECSSIDNTAFKYAAAIIDSKFDEHCAYRDLYSKLELRCARNGATHEFAISSRPEICEESKTDLSLRKKRENQAKNTEPQEENPAHFPSVAPSNTSVPSSATKVP